MPQPETHTPPHASPSPVTHVLLGGFLLLQILLPLSYYVRGGGYDERFAWRMFSAQQQMLKKKDVLVICQELAAGHERDVWKSVSVGGETLATWEVACRRQQPDIIRRYLQWRASVSDAKQTRLRIAVVQGDDLVDRETWLIDHATGEVTQWESQP